MEPLAKTALVTGGTGFLGAAVVKALLLRGYAVRALARKTREAARLARLPIGLVEADIVTSPLADAVADCDVVVHCAAATGVGRSREDCEAINVRGTERVLEAAVTARVKRFIHVSSLSVYGMAPGNYDESSPLRREGDPYGDTKIDAEDRCQSFRDALDLVIVRPALIVGPGDTGFFPMFLDMLRRRRFPLLNGGDASARLVYVDDVAELIAGAAELAPRGGVYNACGPGDLSWRAFADGVCEQHGFVKPSFKVKAGLLYPIARVAEALESVGVRPPVRKAELQFLAEERSYSCERATRELAFRPCAASECATKTAQHFAPRRDTTASEAARA